MAKMSKIVLGSLMALGLSNAAFADVTAQSGMYVGGNIGVAAKAQPDANALIAAGATSASESNGSMSFGVLTGYNYALNSNWLVGGELGWTDFGNSKFSTDGVDGKISADAAQLLATVTYLDVSGWNAFGKLGASHVSQKVSIAGADVKNSGWEPTVVVGVGYMPTQAWNIALQYEYVGGQNAENGATNDKPYRINALMLGATYNFPI